MKESNSMLMYSRAGTPLVANSKNEKGQPIHVGDRKCWRCGGLGGSEKWRATGWTCFRCDGKGVDPIREHTRLYTPEQNAKLDAAQAKRDEKKRLAREEAARIEEVRRQAERDEIISANEGFLGRIDAELAHGHIDFLADLRDQISDRVKEPTDSQVEAVNRIIDRNEKERARRAAARHVGEIKERRVFELTLLHYQCSEGQLPNGIPVLNHWSLLADENGCKIACKSAPWTLGLVKTYPEGRGKDGYYEKNQKVRVKATVVEHKTDKNGEPITYINRPKAA